MSKLTFEFASLNELHGFATEFVLNWGKAAEVAKASKAAAAATTEEKPAKETKPAKEDKPGKASKKEGEETPGITYQDVRQLLVDLQDTDEYENVPKVLEKLGVEKLSALKEDQWPRAHKLLKALLDRSTPLAA